MTVFVFFSTAAWAWIIPSNFGTYFYGFLFYIFGRIYIIIFLGQIIRAASTCKFFFALTHPAHIGSSLPFFVYAGGLVLLYRNAAVAKETYDVFIYFII